MAGLELVCEPLGVSLATAHRPTVPPGGERTVIPAVAIAVRLTRHFGSNLPASADGEKVSRARQLSQACLINLL